MNTGTAKNRIISFLTTNRGQAFTNTQIASALSLPSDSVRRVINELRAVGTVARDSVYRQSQIAV